MKIAFNPSNSSKNILDLIKNNKDIIFDLKGHSIYARGVEFKGTDTNTWRPVVDNLTSNSATSSLSANQGRVLAGLINGKSDSDHNHDGRYIRKSGDTMLGALNFANGTWNLVGDDSYMGDCNISGHFGIKAANTTYPGIAFFNNASAFLGNLTAYSGNIKYGAYSLQFLDNGNTSVSASTWTNPFSAYNSNAVADGQAICVWGQASQLSNLSTDTGDMSLWLKRVNAKVATLNMVLDGEYYANGNQRLAHVTEIPTSLKSPHSLTLKANGTTLAIYDGSSAKEANFTYANVGAASASHTHSYYAVNENYGGFKKAERLPTSGFYQSNESENGGNAPWKSWMHLINCQHSNTNNNYALQIAASFYDNNTFKIRVTNSSVNNAWRDIIHSGNISSQSVASASKLQTARNIWGQSFDGTADVSGSLSGVANIQFSANNAYDIGSNSAASRYIYTHWLGARAGQKLELGANNSNFGQGLCLDTNLNVGIGTNSPTQKLDVRGNIVATGNLYISHATNNNMNHDTSNPRIVFFENGSQAVGLVYTDYDSYRASKGLKVMDVDNNDPSNVWFEVQGYNYSSGYVKNGSNDNYVLLGGGGHKAESSLRVAYADTVDGEHASAFTRIMGRHSIYTSGTAPYNYIHLFRIANSSGYSTVDCEIDFRTKYHSAKLEIRINTAQYPYNSGGSSISIVKKIISGRSCKFWFLPTIQTSKYNYYDVYYESGAWNSGSYGIIFKGSNGSVVFEHNGTNLASLPEKVTEVTSQWVSWNDIAGKPSSFTPSAHEHNYVLDIGNNVHTTFAYSKPGLSKDSITWLAVWNGYELRAMNKDQIALLGHTHTWTSITDKLVAGNEFNIVNAGFKADLWFNYLPINDRSKSATISAYCFGNGNKGYTAVRASGFIKNGGNEDQLLRADGGVAAFNWSGQAGQPTWLWGGNDFNSYYVYSPSNFNVNTAQYLRSLGNQNCQTGRTQAYGDVYTYNTYNGNTGSPTTYTSVIGFGRGTGGTVEIAGGWWNTNLYWRSLRDCCEDWSSWRTVLDSNNYTDFIGSYYWANVKISTSSSTTTSPTVSNLTATSSINVMNILLEHGNEINSDTGLHLNYRTSGSIGLCNGGGNVCIGAFLVSSYKLDVRGTVRSTGFYHASHSNNDAVLLAGGGYKILKDFIFLNVSYNYTDHAHYNLTFHKLSGICNNLVWVDGHVKGSISKSFAIDMAVFPYRYDRDLDLKTICIMGTNDYISVDAVGVVRIVCNDSHRVGFFYTGIA